MKVKRCAGTTSHYWSWYKESQKSFFFSSAFSFLYIYIFFFPCLFSIWVSCSGSAQPLCVCVLLWFCSACACVCFVEGLRGPLVSDVCRQLEYLRWEESSGGFLVVFGAVEALQEVGLWGMWLLAASEPVWFWFWLSAAFCSAADKNIWIYSKTNGFHVTMVFTRK